MLRRAILAFGLVLSFAFSTQGAGVTYVLQTPGVV